MPIFWSSSLSLCFSTFHLSPGNILKSCSFTLLPCFTKWTLLHLITPPSPCWGLSYSKEKERGLRMGSNLKFEYVIDTPSWKHVVCLTKIEDSTKSGSPVRYMFWQAKIIIIIRGGGGLFFFVIRQINGGIVCVYVSHDEDGAHHTGYRGTVWIYGHWVR